MAKTLMEKNRKTTKKKEAFTYVAPTANEVRLAGNFTDWDKEPIAMRKQKDGAWKASVTLKPGVYEYRFLVDGQWRNDENCPTRRPNAFGEENCLREVQ
jgi:1,4-alpha-glucan branching enzyme